MSDITKSKGNRSTLLIMMHATDWATGNIDSPVSDDISVNALSTQKPCTELSSRRVQVMTELESVFNDIATDIAMQRAPRIKLRCADHRDVFFNFSTQSLCHRKTERSKTIKYGSKLFCEISQFDCITLNMLATTLAIMSYIYEALANDQIITKRDIYYRDVEFFQTQMVVDNTITLLTSHLHVQRFGFVEFTRLHN